MPEETEQKIENEDTALAEANQTIEDALMVVCGDDATITGLPLLDNALKKMIKKIAGNVGAALAQATNALEELEDEDKEEEGDGVEDPEQAINDFAVEKPSANEGTRGPNAPQDAIGENKEKPQQPTEPTKQTPSEENAAATPQPTEKEGGKEKGEAGDNGDKEKDDGDKKGDKEMRDNEEKDKEGAGDKEKTPETEKQEPKQASAQPTDEQPQTEPEPKQQQQPEQSAQEDTEQKPRQGEEQQEEQQEEQPEKKQLERSEKGGITQSINALRNRDEIKKIDETIKTLEDLRDPLNRSKRKLMAGLIPLEIAEKSLMGSILFLRLIQITIYIIAALSAITIVLFVLGVTGIIAGGGATMNILITPIKLAKDALKKDIKKIKDKISEINKKIDNLTKNLQKLAGHKRNIRNRSLIESNEKQRREEEQNKEDLET